MSYTDITKNYISYTIILLTSCTSITKNYISYAISTTRVLQEVACERRAVGTYLVHMAGPFGAGFGVYPQ